jgi:hypothetical protein
MMKLKGHAFILKFGAATRVQINYVHTKRYSEVYIHSRYNQLQGDSKQSSLIKIEKWHLRGTCHRAQSI